MDLWIRTQDKMNLVKVNQINVNYQNSFQIMANYIPDFMGKEGAYYEILGTYKSEERALEVLDEIQERIINADAIRAMINIQDKKEIPIIAEYFKEINTSCVYEMPKE